MVVCLCDGERRAKRRSPSLCSRFGRGISCGVQVDGFRPSYLRFIGSIVWSGGFVFAPFPVQLDRCHAVRPRGAGVLFAPRACLWRVARFGCVGGRQAPLLGCLWRPFGWPVPSRRGTSTRGRMTAKGVRATSGVLRMSGRPSPVTFSASPWLCCRPRSCRLWQAASLMHDLGTTGVLPPVRLHLVHQVLLI